MTPLRVVLDGRVINDHFPGIGRYAHRLAAALARTGEIDLTLLVNLELPNTRYPLDELPAERLTQRPVNIAPFTLAEQTRLPALARRLQPDLWHAPYYIMPYRRLPCPTVVTFFDAIPLALPQFWSTRHRLIFRWAHRLALRVATRAIAISASTRDDLVRFLGAEARRISITPLAADDRFRPQPESELRRVRERYRLPERFVLYVGVNKPPKNLPRLIEACARLNADYHCVIAGAWDDRYPDAGRNAPRQTRFIGPVTDADLPALYATADLFVFPSLYEGFGLPPLEAMACGTPVACSRASSLPEVVGEAALLFDPLDVEAVAAAIDRAMGDASLRADLRRRGLARAAQFSWERAARQTLDVYRASFPVS